MNAFSNGVADIRRKMKMDTFRSVKIISIQRRGRGIIWFYLVPKTISLDYNVKNVHRTKLTTSHRLCIAGRGRRCCAYNSSPPTAMIKSMVSGETVFMIYLAMPLLTDTGGRAWRRTIFSVRGTFLSSYFGMNRPIGFELKVRKCRKVKNSVY